MVHRLPGLAPALAAADRADQQEEQQHGGGAGQDPLGAVGNAFHLAQPFGFGLVRGQRLGGGSRRGDQRRLGGHRRGLRVGDDDGVAGEGQGLVQLVPADRVELVGAGHADVHVADEGGAFAGGNALEAVQFRIDGPHGDILHFHVAVVVDGNLEPDSAGNLVNGGAVGLRVQGQDDLLGRVHGDDLHPPGGGFNALAGGFVRLDGELEFLGLGDGQVFFQGDGFTCLDGFAAEHSAQRGVGHGNAGEVKVAGVFQGQGQFDGIARGAAFLVRLQGGGQVDLTVFDGFASHLGGEGFAAGLVGDGGGAGQVLGAHDRGEGIGPGLTGRDGIDRAGFGGNGGVLLDVHGGDVHRSGVGDFIDHADFLAFLGRGGRNRPVDADLGIGAGEGDLLGEALTLLFQLRLAVVVLPAYIDIVGDLEGDLAGVQLVLGNLPLAAPALAGADGQGGRAKFLDLLAAGVIQRNRTGHIAVADIGDGDGNGDRFRPGEFIFAQLHGDLDRILRERGGRAQQNKRDPQRQYKEQAFPVHIVIGARGSFLLPPPEKTAGCVIRMDTGHL